MGSDGRLARAAKQLRGQEFDATVTDSERLALLAEQGAIIVHLDPALGGSQQMTTSFAEMVEADARGARLQIADGPNRSERAEKIRKRIALRVELELPHVDCSARRPLQSCRCLSNAIDRLLDSEAVARSEIVALARELHKQKRQADRRIEQAQLVARKRRNVRSARVFLRGTTLKRLTRVSVSRSTRARPSKFIRLGDAHPSSAIESWPKPFGGRRAVVRR
jgi:hypothetical protein